MKISSNRGIDVHRRRYGGLANLRLRRRQSSCGLSSSLEIDKRGCGRKHKCARIKRHAALIPLGSQRQRHRII